MQLLLQVLFKKSLTAEGLKNGKPKMKYVFFFMFLKCIMQMMGNYAFVFCMCANTICMELSYLCCCVCFHADSQTLK